MLRLICENQNPENPTIAVRWCLDREDRTRLLELDADNAYVMLVVAYENGVAEDRQFRPLTEAMTYVGFRFPGRHTLFARLTYGTAQAMRNTRKNFLQRANQNQYQREELNYDRDGFSERYSGEFNAEPVDVVVDRGHFAKGPSERLKRWVNLPYSFPAIDQCHFRKRMVQAFTLQPIWYAISALAVLVSGILLYARGLTLKPIWDLDDPREVWPQVEMSSGSFRRSAWSLEDKQGYARFHRLFVTPLFMLLGWVGLESLSRQWRMSYWEIILFWRSQLLRVVDAAVAFLRELLAGLSLTTIAVFVGLVALAAIVAWQLFRAVVRTYEKEEARRKTPEYREEQRRLAELRRQQYVEEIAKYLTCPNVRTPSAVALAALPPERRTLRLKFYELKRQVCRPFAG